MTVDGRSGPLTGRVTRVGPVEVSSSSYTYPVVIALSEPGSGIAAGSAGQVQIDLARADAVVVVPTSAVHTSSPGRSYVVVLKGGKTTDQRVALGVVGAGDAQITSGLAKGTTVVLANLSQPVPSSSTNSTTNRSGFGGGFGGGAFPGGGGFPGAFRAATAG